MVADSGAKVLVIDEATLVPKQVEAAVLLLATNMADDVQDAVVAHISETIDAEATVRHIETNVAEDMQ
ncbi:hypothetical protein BGZ83_005552, partial [Gryganskiella cystojenkinii]